MWWRILSYPAVMLLWNIKHNCYKFRFSVYAKVLITLAEKARRSRLAAIFQLCHGRDVCSPRPWVLWCSCWPPIYRHSAVPHHTSGISSAWLQWHCVCQFPSCLLQPTAILLAQSGHRVNATAIEGVSSRPVALCDSGGLQSLFIFSCMLCRIALCIVFLSWSRRGSFLVKS